MTKLTGENGEPRFTAAQLRGMKKALQEKLDEEASFDPSHLRDHCQRHKITVYRDVILAKDCAEWKGRAVDMQVFSAEVWLELRKFYKGVTLDSVLGAFKILANRNKRNLWLEAIPEWDGVPRIRSTITFLLGAKYQEGWRRWLLGMAGLQYYRDIAETATTMWRPPMLILYSPLQGVGKNWLLKQFGLGLPMVYRDGFDWPEVTGEDRDTLRRVKRSVLVSFDENPTALGREQEPVKAFLTRTHMPTRAMYERTDDHDDALLSSFAGTTNNRHLITDHTGSRRFCIIDLSRKKHIEDFPAGQLLAEALTEAHDFKWDGTNTPPWACINDETETANNDTYLATATIFDEIIEEAFDRAPVKNLVGIKAEIKDQEARHYLLRDPWTLGKELAKRYFMRPNGEYETYAHHAQRVNPAISKKVRRSK